MANPPPPPPLYRDPWAKADAWRKLPVFQLRNTVPKALPGFGTAIVAFTCYVIADNFLFKSEEKQHH